MEVALYCPDFGYYEREKDNVGKRGDFYTSVSVGSLFGELLAFQFAEWLAAASGTKSGVRIVETGAHDGKLAADILAGIRQFNPGIFDRLNYCVVEPSARRKEWQRETLNAFEKQVTWVPEIAALKSISAVETILFSNELLDAMPIRRFGWDAQKKEWFEWGVALADGKFVWTRIPISNFKFQISDLEPVLPDGYTIETSPAAEAWWREAASVLKHGKLVAIDYGLTSEEQFSPSRPNGTLRAYYQHRVTDDVLASPGEQDLTAHVNFSAIQKVGEEAGLKTELFCGQSQFLVRIAEKIFQRTDSFGKWDASRLRQFQTLTHPEHLGRAFRVLVQSR